MQHPVSQGQFLLFVFPLYVWSFLSFFSFILSFFLSFLSFLSLFCVLIDNYSDSVRFRSRIHFHFLRSLGDFPGSTVVKTPCFQSRGCGLDPWSGESKSHIPHGVEEHTLLFLCRSQKFSLKTGYFKWYSMATLEIRFFSLLKVCCCCCYYLLLSICLVTLVN